MVIIAKKNVWYVRYIHQGTQVRGQEDSVGHSCLLTQWEQSFKPRVRKHSPYFLVAVNINYIWSFFVHLWLLMVFQFCYVGPLCGALAACGTIQSGDVILLFSPPSLLPPHSYHLTPTTSLLSPPFYHLTPTTSLLPPHSYHLTPTTTPSQLIAADGLQSDGTTIFRLDV